MVNLRDENAALNILEEVEVINRRRCAGESSALWTVSLRRRLANPGEGFKRLWTWVRPGLVSGTCEQEAGITSLPVT